MRERQSIKVFLSAWRHFVVLQVYGRRLRFIPTEIQSRRRILFCGTTGWKRYSLRAEVNAKARDGSCVCAKRKGRKDRHIVDLGCRRPDYYQKIINKNPASASFRTPLEPHSSNQVLKSEVSSHAVKRWI